MFLLGYNTNLWNDGLIIWIGLISLFLSRLQASYFGPLTVCMNSHTQIGIIFLWIITSTPLTLAGKWYIFIGELGKGWSRRATKMSYMGSAISIALQAPLFDLWIIYKHNYSNTVFSSHFHYICSTSVDNSLSGIEWLCQHHLFPDYDHIDDIPDMHATCRFWTVDLQLLKWKICIKWNINVHNSNLPLYRTCGSEQ